MFLDLEPVLSDLPRQGLTQSPGLATLSPCPCFSPFSLHFLLSCLVLLFHFSFSFPFSVPYTPVESGQPIPFPRCISLPLSPPSGGYLLFPFFSFLVANPNLIYIFHCFACIVFSVCAIHSLRACTPGLVVLPTGPLDIRHPTISLHTHVLPALLSLVGFP